MLEALKKFFKWALEKLGIDAEGFFNTLSKMGSAIKAMFKSPGKFFSNLIDSIKGSINDFRANFKTYIIGALADWLTGAMGSTGIEIPKEFSVRAVIGMLLQVLGLSWAFLRGKLVALIGEEKVAWAEKTVDVVKKFVTGGIAALWDWIKDQATSIKDMFIQGTKDWLLTTLVTKFVEWIASLLIPGGAILRLVQGIYNLVMWFVNNIQKILRWVNAVIDSLGNVAAGAISAAIGFIVNAMKIIIPVILDFFARLLNISGIVDAVKNIINKIAAPIHAAINKVIDWVVGWVKKMFGKGKEKKKSSDGKSDVGNSKDKEGAYSKAFSMSGESHHIYVYNNNGKPDVTMASQNEDKVKGKFIRASKTIENYNKEISEDSDSRKDFDKEIKPFANLLLSDYIDKWLKKIENLKSKEKISILESGELKSDVEELINYLVEWGDKHGIKDMTPEAINLRIEEAKEKIWREKQEQCEKIMSKYISLIKKLDANAELMYRGSLAKGKKFDKVSEKHVAFNPNDFDVDAFIMSDKIWKMASARMGPVEPYWGSSSGIIEIVEIINKLRVELLEVSGMRKFGKLASFDIIIKSVSSTKDLFKKFDNEKHRTIKE